MSKNANRRYKNVYPEEKEGKIKDANKTLKAENKFLRKRVKELEEAVRTLKRGFDKSINYVKSTQEGMKVEDVIKLVDKHDFKETQKGRKKEKERQETIFEEENFILNNCPKCDKNRKEGFIVLDYGKFSVVTCSCGYRDRVEGNEGIEGN